MNNDIDMKNNHFRYIDPTKKSFTTLINVRLIHSNKHSNLSENIIPYDYKITNKVDIPYYRGARQYAIISVISIEKIQ